MALPREGRTDLPSNTKETLSPLPVLMIVIYPTVPGAAAPSSDAAGGLHGAHDLWDTAGAGAVVRTCLAFASITLVHLVIFFHMLVRGSRRASCVEERMYFLAASIALWLTTTCFFVTYASMARYGAQTWEWFVAAGFSAVIFFITFDFLGAPCRDDNILVNDPLTAV